MAKSFKSIRPHRVWEDDDSEREEKIKSTGVDAPLPSDDEELDDEPRDASPNPTDDAVRQVYIKRSDGTYTLAENIRLVENILDTLKKVVMKHQAGKTKLSDGSVINVDVQTANALLKIYGALNQRNQEKMARMLQSSKGEFSKVLGFAWSKMSGPGQATKAHRIES
jgi:hypothetical protein